MFVLEFRKDNNYLYTIHARYGTPVYRQLLEVFEEFNAYLFRDNYRLYFHIPSLTQKVWDICIPPNSWHRAYVVPDRVDVRYCIPDHRT